MNDRETAWQSAHDLEDSLDWTAAVNEYLRLLEGGHQDDSKLLFRLGHAYFHLSNLEMASKYLLRATQHRPGVAAWHYRLAYVLERRGQYGAAVENYTRALEIEPAHDRWRHRLEITTSARDRADARERVAREVEAAAHSERVLDLVQRKAPKWQELAALEAGLDLHRESADWNFQLAEAQFAMNRFEEAAESYGAATVLEGGNPQAHFMQGWAWDRAGKSHLARHAYRRAVNLDDAFGSKMLGIGVFFQRKGQWPLAAKAYRDTLKNSPSNAELHYKLGFALQRCYDWEGAEEALRAAITLSPETAQWHYRRGFSLERLERWQEAAASYAYAAGLDEIPNSYWYFRLGFVLTQLHKYEEACEAFAQTRKPESLPSSPPVSLRQSSGHYLEKLFVGSVDLAKASQSPQLCYELGTRAESYGLVEVAAEAYEASVQRTEAHAPSRYYRLANSLSLLGEHESACGAYLETRLFKQAHGVDTSNYLKDRHKKESMVYVEYMDFLKIRNNVIMYESGHGSSVSCNPLQICKALLLDVRFAGFTHVWVLNKKDRVPVEFKGNPNIIFVARDCDLYLRYLASAKYLINNNTFPPYFSRRDEQKYLNTWHGTPLKTLGRDIKNGTMDHRNAARNFLHATHIIAPNDFTANCLIEKYDVAGLFNGKVAVTGYPRVDATLATPTERRAELRALLGIAPNAKVLLYAPTWRGSLSDRSIDAERLIQDVAEMSRLNCHFLFRGHPVTEDQLSTSAIDSHTVPSWVDTNELLSIVDVLITDYSSILFDFMPTGRSIFYYAYDLEEYSRDRGLYFNIDKLPGTVCLDLSSLLTSLQEALLQSGVPTMPDTASSDKFCALETGDSTQRVVDFFFFEATDFEVDNYRNDKKNLLMFQGSFIPNGITSSYLNLVSHIDPDSNNVYLCVDPITIFADPLRIEKFSDNPDYVHVLARVGAQLVTAEERWIIDKFNAQRDLSSDEQWSIYRRGFRREFRRMFGDADFSSVVSFEGYARFWAALLANPSDSSVRKVIYLHTDMEKEWNNRFSYLEGNFRLYRSYDALVSVTKSVSEENTRQLADAFAIPRERFTFCNNLVNAEATLQLASEKLDPDVSAWAEGSSSLFVSLGRLSPEKGHAKLIRAFAEVLKNHQDARLVLVGDGPLREKLELLVEDLNLSSHVKFAGQRLNPFPVLLRADCFVFSSDYEGQGLVVLEALILGRPVISTDVVGPRSVLEGGYGLLVDNSITGLAAGMNKFLTSEIPHREFDYEAYQLEAVSKFKQVALGTA